MSCAAIESSPAQQVGRYTICDQLAAGGMATVHLARLVGSAGFSRVVAAKRMHRHFMSDPEFKQMFLAEAQLAARIQHPNVVPILDVLTHEDELVIFMDYVHGESLHALMRTAHESQKPIPIPIGCAIIVGALQGLHAAHEARSELGEPLGIVHRDISPQNILVGADGVSRVLDFGIAKALHEQNHTDPGTLKGKFSYMAPEVINGAPITRQTDVFSAGVVLWELLTGRKLFGGSSEQERLRGIISAEYPSPRRFNAQVPATLEQVVNKALQADPKARFANALEFAIAIEVATPIAAQHVVGEWVRRIAARTLDERMARIHRIETAITHRPTRPSLPPIQSLTVPAKHDALRQSVLTAVASPTAKQRHDKRRLALAWTGLTLAILVGSVFWLRSGVTAPTDSPDVGSVPTPTDPAPSAGIDTSLAPRASHPVPPAESNAEASEKASLSGNVRTSAPRKPSASRAVSVPRTRAKAPSHVKPYLPSEL
jgi:eukaryotic-like serine/threonine-protein kinase